MRPIFFRQKLDKIFSHFNWQCFFIFCKKRRLGVNIKKVLFRFFSYFTSFEKLKSSKKKWPNVCLYYAHFIYTGTNVISCCSVKFMSTRQLHFYVVYGIQRFCFVDMNGPFLVSGQYFINFFCSTVLYSSWARLSWRGLMLRVAADV